MPRSLYARVIHTVGEPWILLLLLLWILSGDGQGFMSSRDGDLITNAHKLTILIISISVIKNIYHVMGVFNEFVFVNRKDETCHLSD